MTGHSTGSSFHLPSPTPWPMVLALGITFFAAGLVTSLPVSLVGAVLFLVALMMLLREDMSAEHGDGSP